MQLNNIKLYRIIISLLWLHLCLIDAAFNQAMADHFTVRNINITSEAEDISQARLAAVEDGEKKALVMMLRKLVPASLHHKIENIDKKYLIDLVQELDVSSEKFKPGHYNAVLSVTFNHQAVNQLLHKLEIITHHEPDNTGGEDILIIPVFKKGEQVILWEENNHWKAAWDKVLVAGHKGFILPVGDLEDISIISDDVLDNQNLDNLRSIMEKYEVKKAAIAFASYYIDRVSNLPTINLTVTYINEHGRSNFEQPVTSRENAALQNLLEQAVHEVINHKPIPMVSEPVIASNQHGNQHLEVTLNIATINQWVIAKHKLLRVPGVNKVELQELALNHIIAALSYMGSEQELIAHVKHAGFEVNGDKGKYILSIAPKPEYQ